MWRSGVHICMVSGKYTVQITVEAFSLFSARLPKQPKIQMLLVEKLIMWNHSYTNHVSFYAQSVYVIVHFICHTSLSQFPFHLPKGKTDLGSGN